MALPNRLSLPLAVANGTLLARKLPVEVSVVSVYLLAVEEGRYVHTVYIARQTLAAARYLRKGGHEVGEVNQVAEVLHRHLSGLVYDERNPYAALIELPLVAFEARSAVQLFERSHDSRAVIRREDNQCVLPQAQSVERAQNPSDVIVHVCHQGGIALGVGAPVALVVIPRRVVDVVRLVRSVVSQIKEEGMVLLTVDKGYGIIGRNLGVVPHMGVVLVLTDVDEAVAMKAIVGIIIVWTVALGR